MNQKLNSKLLLSVFKHPTIAWILATIGALLITELFNLSKSIVILVSLIFTILFASYKYSINPKLKIYKQKIWLIATAFIVMLSFLYLFTFTSVFTAKTEPVVKNDKCKDPVTVHDYFECDFSQNLYFYETQFRSSPAGNFNYEVTIFIDWDANSYFYSFYTPVYDKVFDFYWYLGSDILNFSDSIVNKGKWEMGNNAGQTFSVNKMTFTKTVYIYYNGILPQNDKDSISASFKRNGVNVYHRGQDYAMMLNSSKVKF